MANALINAALRTGLSTGLVMALLLGACGENNTDTTSRQHGEAVSSSAAPATAATDFSAATQNLSIPELDSQAPLPGLSAFAVDALSADVPELAAHRDTIRAAEQDAIQKLLAEFRGNTRNTADAALPAFQQHGFPGYLHAPASVVPGTLPVILHASLDYLIPPALASEMSWGNITALGVGGAFTRLMGGMGDLNTSKGGISSRTEMPGKVSGTVDAAVTITADQGGIPTAELTTKVDIPQFLLEANSRVTLTGRFCPDADGVVEFTIKLGSNGRAGSGGSAIYDQNVEAKVTASVGDDAKVRSVDMDVKQATRSTAGGKQVYVESQQSLHSADGSFKDIQTDGATITRASAQATDKDASLSSDGLTRAMMLAIGALNGAEGHWQSGNCITIMATSPGGVSPGAVSKIPVKVVHKHEGGEVPAKVTVELSGGASVEPTVIAPAPGDITHTAVNERRAHMQIKLVATSRRGMDEETLKLSTYQGYAIEGGADEFFGYGTICDINEPFTVEGNGVVVKFVPSSDQGGSYSYTGSMSGFSVFGQGSYTVAYQGEIPVAINTTGPGSVKTPLGTQTTTDSEKYTLAPSRNAYCE